MMSVGHYRDTGKKGVPTVTGYSLLFPGIRHTQEVSQELSNLKTDSSHCCAVLVNGACQRSCFTTLTIVALGKRHPI